MFCGFSAARFPFAGLLSGSTFKTVPNIFRVTGQLGLDWVPEETDRSKIPHVIAPRNKKKHPSAVLMSFSFFPVARTTTTTKRHPTAVFFVPPWQGVQIPKRFKFPKPPWVDSPLTGLARSLALSPEALAADTSSSSGFPGTSMKVFFTFNVDKKARPFGFYLVCFTL